MACAPSEDSDQPGHPPSLRWVHSHFVYFVMRRLTLGSNPHQRSELSHTILCNFSRGNQRIGEGFQSLIVWGKKLPLYVHWSKISKFNGPLLTSKSTSKIHVSVCACNGNLTCHRVLISGTPKFVLVYWLYIAVYVWVYCLSSFSWGIPILTVQECHQTPSFTGHVFCKREWRDENAYGQTFQISSVGFPIAS